MSLVYRSLEIFLCCADRLFVFCKSLAHIAKSLANEWHYFWHFGSCKSCRICFLCHHLVCCSDPIAYLTPFSSAQGDLSLHCFLSACAASMSSSICWLGRCQESPPWPRLGAAAVNHWASLQAKTSGCRRRQNDGWKWLRPVETSACVRAALARHDVNLIASDRCDRFMWRVWRTYWKAEWNGVCFREGEQPDSLLCPYRNRSQERTRCQASGGNDCGYVVTDGLSACLHLLL